MKNIFKIAFLLLMFGLSNKVNAQEHTITLDSSKKAALNYSYIIKNSHLNYQSSELDKLSTEANRLPTVDGTGFIMYGFKDFVKAVPPLLNKGINNFYFAGASATEPIYMGGKIKTGIELSQLQMEVNKIKEKQAADSVVLLTEQKYWRLVQLQEQYKVLLANEVWVDGVMKQMKDMLASGLIARNDLLKVKVRKSELELSKSKLKNGHKLAIFDFSLYTGIPYDSLLVAIDTLGTLQKPDQLFVSPEEALTSNNDMHLLEQNSKAKKLQTKLTKADYMPTVAAGVNVRQFGVIGNGQFNNFMPIAFGTVSVPISGLWWGSGKHKMKQQKINEEIAQNNLIDGQRQIKTGILQNWYDMVDAYQQISYANDNLEEATENLKVSRDNFSSGLMGITDLLDAQASYQQASSSIVDSYAEYRSKIASYLHITGKLSSASNTY